MTNNEYHIASFVVQALPIHSKFIVKLIEENPKMEVHAVSEIGKIVFTAEDTSQKLISDHADVIKQHPYVLSLSPVYHQFLTEEHELPAGEV